MIPYFTLPVLPLGPLKIQPFGLLVVIGILIGTALARWRAPRYSVTREELDSFVMWMLVGGFAGAHVLDSIFYHPHELASRPWSILFIWEGLSSFGGFTGALFGVLAWKRFKGGGKPILPICDLIVSVFPVAWIFGRAGCSVVHDHPGAPTSASHWLAVNFGDHLYIDGVAAGVRWDLGVLECLFALAVSLLIAPTWRKRMPVGFYVAVVPMAYAPVRFLLDFLRIPDASGGDLRWGVFTFAQWLCVALFAFGVVMLAKVLRRGAGAETKGSVTAA
jgi:phosphatidylglycerol:prolipoprotein diacylglycerol transferase